MYIKPSAKHSDDTDISISVLFIQTFRLGGDELETKTRVTRVKNWRMVAILISTE